jgi:DNA ligase N terminus/ATP dependent DNA ligase domain
MEDENDHVAQNVAEEPQQDDDENDDDDANDIRAEGLVGSDDDEANENDDYDPVAEGEEEEQDETRQRRLEPSLKFHGESTFSGLCKRLEYICRRKHDKKKRSLSKQDMLNILIPPRLFEEEKARMKAGVEPPESIFPMLRLLYPDQDSSRRLGVKEAKLAEVYIDAYDWNSKFKEYHMLKNYNDPKLVGGDGIAGNFSLVLQKVLTGIDGETRLDTTPSTLTLNDINRALDELSAIDKQGRGNNNNNNKSKQGGGGGGKPKTKKSQKAAWMKQFLFGPKRIPPLEHKWLVRIIIGKLEFGIGFDAALKHYHFMAPQTFSAHSSLRITCERVCYIPRTRHVSSADDEGGADTKGGVNAAGTLSYLTGPSADVQLGKVFAPMLSQKTGFERILNDISKRHRAFARVATEAAKERGGDHPATNSLACQHPAFTIETKLDGDRMIMHYERDGSLVKFHSRRNKWHSTGYSPVLGPAIRKAFGWNDLDLILDGEVISWDNCRQETVPFGFNRMIAKKRHEYMGRNGLLDHRDRNLHKDEQDSTVYNALTSWDGKSSSDESADLTGRECWLQYIVFDVVYVGGPGAADFLSKTVSSYLTDLKPGCIMGLDAFERKKIVYRLCRTQVNEVEIVPTIVVRPNGGVALGSEYFSDTSPIQEYGHPAHKIDSVASVLVGHVPNIVFIDEKHRERLSDEETSQARANAIDRHYKEIVELRRLEGLVFKDLNTPYVLDLESRALRYWFKFKPDYFCGSIASDIDVVVVGAYFAVRKEDSARTTLSKAVVAWIQTEGC